MTHQVVWTARDWCLAIDRLPAEGPLPCRTVLVPRERVAHALRRELVRLGLGPSLAGTRFVTPLAAAIEVLGLAGIDAGPGEESLRPARLSTVFRRDLRLAYFPADLLRSRPGWHEAFARTIGDLEGAGFQPADLAASSEARLSDIAEIWRAAEESAGFSWTAPRIFREVAAVLAARPDAWPFPGAALAVVNGHETAMHARFLQAIPDVTIALEGARPRRARHLRRVEALYGRPAADALETASAPRAAGTERDLLASFLFEPPPTLAARARPRSAGPDGTVDIEEHAGVEDEVEATADWVARRIVEGTPLEEIGILLPSRDPLAGLVRDRLARLPFVGETLPVLVADGVPLTSSASGVRLLAVVRALRAHLAGDSLVAVLPALRTVPDGSRHLSHGAAMDLAWSLGTAGGNPARPDGALEWADRAASREGELAAQLAQALAAGDDPERAGLARQARDIERLLEDLRAVRPAVEALVHIAGLALRAAPLAEIWTALDRFATDWLLQPGAGAPAHGLVAQRLGSAAADPACRELAGDDALRMIEEIIGATRLSEGRFGDPAVYVGTVHGAVGLPFGAVRVIGLAEGHLPSVPREDPVLPDGVREGLGVAGAGPTLPTAADRALEALHALDHVVRNGGHHVALSFPRRDAERTDREPAAVLLEAAAALGRPGVAGGGRLVPDLSALRRDAFLPAGESRHLFRRAMPLSESAWQDGVALAVVTRPASWRTAGACDLDRIARLRSDAAAGPLDGFLGDATIAVPGLSADRPISPSRLESLLRCPHQFLLANLLGFEEPAGAPPRREIGQPAYGALVHRVAEAFYRDHGAAFCERRETLGDWLARIDAIAEREFDLFLAQYPLVGEAVRNQQRERLRADARSLLQYDWEVAGGRFVAAERTFGYPTPVELSLPGGSLFVRGRIDRLDVDGETASVRDLKTGRPYPRTGRDAEPQPTRDVQIAVYGLVVQRLAREWGVPERVSAAYVYVGSGADEREYRRDFDRVLAPAARDWLDLGGALLRERLFPRTADPVDCSYCAFRPVCGDAVYARARSLLAAGSPALARFGRMKRVDSATLAAEAEGDDE